MATTFYITAGLPALDSAGTPETDDKSRFYITAGLPANDYAAANVKLLLLNNTLGGDASRMTQME